MSIWVSLGRALTAMEAVHRLWARQLGLEVGETHVLLALARRSMSNANIAEAIGRQRQQVQRTLSALHSRGLATPSVVSPAGKIQAWALTETGADVARRLEARTRAWERMSAPAVQLDALAEQLNALVRGLVNEPQANGWVRGLSQPYDARHPFCDGLPLEMVRLKEARRRAEGEPASQPREEDGQAEEGLALVDKVDNLPVDPR